MRLLRVNELKEHVDTKNISIRAAVEISFLSAECQQMLYECMSRMGITALNVNTAWELKELSKSVKDITPDMIERILNGSSALSVKLNRKNRIAPDQEVFDKYFRNVPKKEVVGIVEKALETYFNGARA